MQTSATEIYQQWLDQTGDIIMSDGMDGISQYFSLPYLHRSPDTRILIETVEDMIEGHRAYRNALRALGVNQLIRLVSGASFLSKDYVHGTHTVHALRDGKRLLPRFNSSVVLRKCGAFWKQAEVRTVLRHSDWPIELLRVKDGESAKPLSHAADIRREPWDALEIYQRFLDKLTAATVRNDGNDYARLYHFPVSLHTQAEDSLIRGTPDVTKVVDTIYNFLTDNKVDTFRRIADQAKFVSASEICGYHIAQFFSGGKQIMMPVRSRMILIRERREWRVNSISNALSNADFPQTTPVVSNDLITEREIHKRTKQWPNSH